MVEENSDNEKDFIKTCSIVILISIYVVLVHANSRNPFQNARTFTQLLLKKTERNHNMLEKDTRARVAASARVKAVGVTTSDEMEDILVDLKAEHVKERELKEEESALIPKEVFFTTGEENEDVLFLDLTAKLARKEVRQWKWKWVERGVGAVKLLRHKETGRVRLLMRQSKTLKICVNHIVLPSMNLQERNEKSCVWQASNYTDGGLKNETLCIHFASVENCKRFKQKVQGVVESQSPPTAVKPKKVERSAATEEDVEEMKRRKEKAREEVLISSNPESSGTALVAMRYKAGVVTAADSRCIFGTFGNVSTDTDVKLCSLYDNICVSEAGTAHENDKAMRNAAFVCLLKIPRSVEQAAKILARTRGRLPGLSSFIVTGRAFGEYKSKIFEVFPKNCDRGRRNVFKDKASDKYIYEARECDYAYAGSGGKPMKDYVKTRSYDAHATQRHEVRGIIKNAMSHARSVDYCSDGEIKLVEIEDRDTKVLKDGVRLWECKPRVAKDCASGYGNWVAGTFEPRRFY